MKTSILFSLVIVISAFLWTGCNDDDSNTCIANVDPDCFCTLQYDPVCGCDNVTYGNACQAECSDITDYTPGECP